MDFAATQFTGPAIADIEIGAGHLAQHERKILRGHDQRAVAVDVFLADQFRRDVGDKIGLAGGINGGREQQPEINLDLGAKAGRDPCGGAAHVRLDQIHGGIRETAHRARDAGLLRDHVIGVPGMDLGDREHR